MENVERFQERLERHSALLWDLLCKVELVAKSDRLTVIRFLWFSPHVHLFVGWGEVLAPARGRFHGGGNLALLLFPALLMKRVTLLGGFSRAQSMLDKGVHRLTLKWCVNCVCREHISYEYVVSTYRSHKPTLLYHDFALDIVDSLKLSILTQKDLISITWRQCPYLVVNATPYIDIDELTDLVKSVLVETGLKHVVYVPWDIEDKPILALLRDRLWHVEWTQFDWTQHDILMSMSTIQRATKVVAVRLHLIATARRLDTPYAYLVYQEKITKFLNSQSVTKDEGSM